jgi:hypothetical protein
MKPKAESQRMRCFPHGHFGDRVLRFHLRHRPGTMGCILLCLPYQFPLPRHSAISQVGPVSTY